MTKRDIVKKIAETTDAPLLSVNKAVQMLFDGITDILVDERNIELRNFGIFKVKQRKSRKARNPRTGEAVNVPTRSTVDVKAGKELLVRLTRIERPVHQ
jgi:nucleoid DNA-binding protein